MRLVILDESHLLQVASPDGQRAGTRALSEEVMSGVVHDQAKVQVASEVNGELDLGDIGDVDRVWRKASKLAFAAGGSVLRLTCGAVEQGRHH